MLEEHKKIPIVIGNQARRIQTPPKMRFAYFCVLRGFMGYDATNLFEINPHFGTKQDAWRISVRFGQKIPRFKKTVDYKIFRV